MTGVARDAGPAELTLAQVMLPEDANPRGNVHGGTLMKLADTAGGVCATRHTRQTQRLLAVSAGLAVTHTVDEVAAALVAEGRTQTGADAATVVALEEGGPRVLAQDPADGSADPWGMNSSDSR